MSRLYYVGTIKSVQSTRIVVYSFVAGNIGPDDTVSGFNVRVDDSAIQYVKRRPKYGTSFVIAAVFILQPKTVLGTSL